MARWLPVSQPPICGSLSPDPGFPSGMDPLPPDCFSSCKLLTCFPGGWTPEPPGESRDGRGWLEPPVRRARPEGGAKG